ncbi:MAG: S-adenosylhomocysteine deaminase, partial [Planctomycetaceae bacterium]
MREVDTIISGGRILLLDEKCSRIENGFVAIEGDEIVAVGKAEDIKDKFTWRKMIDARDSLIMPGLVN